MSNGASTIQGPVSGQVVDLIGNTITFKAVSANTGGAYSLVDVVTAPGAGSPPHRQHDDDEAFFVLEGTYTILMDGENIQAKAGDYIFVQRGALHAFQNATEESARMLIINSPGGLHERFFFEIGTPVGQEAGPFDFPAFLESAARYGIELQPAAE